jgi:hypothetical protein
MEINIGQMLTAHFKKHRIRLAALARLMQLDPSNFMLYQKNESIQTKRLLEISQHLKHNFFMDIAMLLPPEYSTTKNPTAEKDLRIAQQEAEITRLKTENEVLLKVLGAR